MFSAAFADNVRRQVAAPRRLGKVRAVAAPEQLSVTYEKSFQLDAENQIQVLILYFHHPDIFAPC